VYYYYKRNVKSTNIRKEGNIKGVSQERKHNGQREKNQKDHHPQNTAQTTKYGAIRTPLKTARKLRCPGTVSCSCSISGNC
jgi:6-phosphogluconolactonase (cycloisomerase 2 family)